MAIGKHFINGIDNPVHRSLRGLLIGNASLRFIAADNVLYLERENQMHKVLLISGGGAGHEPAHAGYIGEGMLDIVVSGDVFASPSAVQVLAGLRALDSPKGILMIVKNYTGDKLNFGLAAERAKAEGLNIRPVFVQDDVSVQGNSMVGQRGLAGVVLVHKVAGAQASQGASLNEVVSTAERVEGRMATAAVSLDKCSVPNRADQLSLPPGSIEYGMGIHNEPGVRREEIQSLEKTVQELVSMLLKGRVNGWRPVPEKEVAVLVNNLGGLSVLELNVFAEEVFRSLSREKLIVSRYFVGTFVTSLDAPGVSVTILEVDSQTKQLLDAPTTAPAWPRFPAMYPGDTASQQVERKKSEKPFVEPEHELQVHLTKLSRIMQSIVERVKEDEPSITKYDVIAGDGDCGETLLKGVAGFEEEVRAYETGSVGISRVFRSAATAAETCMGGTSGAIYAIFLNAMATSLESTIAEKSAPGTISLYIANALADGLNELCKYTLAREGHRTLMDALIPFVETFHAKKDFVAAFHEAQEGAARTKSMAATFGRASYVDEKRFVEQGGIPDPGALGIVSILRGLSVGLSI